MIQNPFKPHLLAYIDDFDMLFLDFLLSNLFQDGQLGSGYNQPRPELFDYAIIIRAC